MLIGAGHQISKLWWAIRISSTIVEKWSCFFFFTHRRSPKFGTRYWLPWAVSSARLGLQVCDRHVSITTPQIVSGDKTSPPVRSPLFLQRPIGQRFRVGTRPSEGTSSESDRLWQRLGAGNLRNWRQDPIRPRTVENNATPNLKKARSLWNFNGKVSSIGYIREWSSDSTPRPYCMDEGSGDDRGLSVNIDH